MSAGCVGSPCAFGCTPNGVNGFICGCPTGYQRIGQVRDRNSFLFCFKTQIVRKSILISKVLHFKLHCSNFKFLVSTIQGHCLSTINPLSQGQYGEDISNAPTFVINPDPYHIPPADDKTISTEGCFSCKVVSRNSILKLDRVITIERTGQKKRSLPSEQVNGKGRHRRHSRLKSTDRELAARRNEMTKRRFVRSARRHHHGEEHVLKISLRQTRHRMRIVKLQPAVKVCSLSLHSPL